MRPRLLLSVAVLLAFGASVTHGFHFDDYAVIHGASLKAWQSRPLTWFSFAVNARLGTHPALWHLVNLVLHGGAVLLLYELLLRLISQPAALLGAAIFAVHPIQAESVAYVYSRGTLFSAMFSLLAGLLWVRGQRWWAVAAFALALVSKEDCATVPLVLLLFEFRRLRERWRPLAAMLLLSGLAALHTLWLTKQIAASGAGFTAGISPGAYLLTQGFVILRYLQLLVVPYGFTIDPSINVGTALAIVCWILIAAAAVVSFRKHRWFVAGLILLLPSSSFLPLADLAADHRMYLPMTAFASGAAMLLLRLPRAVGTGVVVVLIVVSSLRMNVWASEKRLWSEAVERAPDKLRPRLQLSRALEPAQAIEELQQTEKLYPNDADIHAEEGRAYLQMGRPDLALAEFGRVLGQRPGDAHAINNRGVALRALGQESAAKQDFERALKIDGCMEEARQNLGLARCR